MNFASAVVLVLGYIYPIFSLVILQKIFAVHQNQRNTIYLSLFALLNWLITSVLILYSYGIGWIFAVPIFLIVPALGVAAAFILFKGEKRIEASNTIESTYMPSMGAKLASIMVVISFILVPFTATKIGSACDIIHQSKLNQLIQAMESYKIKYGLYPNELSSLVPDYVQAIPIPVCLQPYDWVRDAGEEKVTKYVIEQCDTDTTLSFRSTDLDWTRVYSFTTRQWRRVDWLNGCTCGCDGD